MASSAEPPQRHTSVDTALILFAAAFVGLMAGIGGLASLPFLHFLQTWIGPRPFALHTMLLSTGLFSAIITAFVLPIGLTLIPWLQSSLATGQKWGSEPWQNIIDCPPSQSLTICFADDTGKTLTCQPVNRCLTGALTMPASRLQSLGSYLQNLPARPDTPSPNPN